MYKTVKYTKYKTIWKSDQPTINPDGTAFNMKNGPIIAAILFFLLSLYIIVGIILG